MASPRTALAAALVLAAAGCSGPSTTWRKEGATALEVRRDEKACVAEAERYGFLVNPGSPGQAAGARARQPDQYRLCMYDRGYVRGPIVEDGKKEEAE